MSAARAETPTAEEQVAARQRHPCMRPPVPRSWVVDLVVDELSGRGARHPAVAAAVLAVRGASGLHQEAFARRSGVAPELLGQAERGELSREDLPGALRRMVPR